MLRVAGPAAVIAPANVIELIGPRLAAAATGCAGDADAGGAAAVVKMTGTDQAAPLTIRLRLKPLSFESIWSFKISDNCAPTVVSATACRW